LSTDALPTVSDREPFRVAAQAFAWSSASFPEALVMRLEILLVLGALISGADLRAQRQMEDLVKVKGS